MGGDGPPGRPLHRRAQRSRPTKKSGSVDSNLRGRTLNRMHAKCSDSTEKTGMARRTFLGTALLTGGVLLAKGSDIIFGAESSGPSKVATNPTWKLGGDLTVNRLGFGAMRVTGEGIWGWPSDRG